MGSLPKDQTGTSGAPAGTVENTLDSCGTETDVALAQVKGLAGLLVTKMSNRKEEEGRKWLLLSEMLLAAFLLNVTAF